MLSYECVDHKIVNDRVFERGLQFALYNSFWKDLHKVVEISNKMMLPVTLRQGLIEVI